MGGEFGFRIWDGSGWIDGEMVMSENVKKCDVMQCRIKFDDLCASGF